MVHNLSTETDGDVVVNAKSPGIIDAVQSANAQQPPPSAPWSVEAGEILNAPGTHVTDSVQSELMMRGQF